MRFYNRQPRHSCGIDLRVKTMYVCILDATGHVLVHRNVQSTPEAFLETMAPYRDNLVVAAECTSLNRCWGPPPRRGTRIGNEDRTEGERKPGVNAAVGW